MNPKKKKKNKKKILFFRIAAAAFTILFGVSTVMLVRELRQTKKETDTFSELSAMRLPRGDSHGLTTQPIEDSEVETIMIVINERGETTYVTENTTEPANTEETTGEEQTESGQERKPLQTYSALHEKNRDFFGWITVPDTKVDYPVMFSPDRPLQYLGHDFFGSASYHGVPFLDAECDPNGNFYLVYGHHMEDGTMFAGLVEYDKKSFWENHPTFRFDTLYEERTYAVVIAMRGRVLNVDEEGFRYYNYTSLDTEAEFMNYIRQAKQLARYDTGVDVSFGDELLVLSTCYHYTSNGRFVVIAKRIG